MSAGSSSVPAVVKVCAFYGGEEKGNMRSNRKTGTDWTRAAMTVEASFLVPWTVLLTALLIVILFYMHNRVWYETAALEAGLAGNQYIAGSGGSGRAGLAVGNNGENPAGAGKAEQTAQARIRDQAMPGSEPSSATNCTNAGTEVSFAGQEYPLFSEYFSLDVKETVKKVRPVPVIRNAWVLKDTVKGWEDTKP